MIQTKEQAAYSCVNVNCSFTECEEKCLGLDSTSIFNATFSENYLYSNLFINSLLALTKNIYCSWGNERLLWNMRKV